MIVISDATPVNILIRIGFIHVLPHLFDTVLLPTAVIKELSHPRAPQIVREWAAQLPGWAQVRSPNATGAGATGMGAGEREAILLALEVGADLLLVDDHQARQAAKREGLFILGTVGVLERASQRHLLSLVDAVDRLKNTDFRVDAKLLESALERDRLRNK